MSSNYRNNRTNNRGGQYKGTRSASKNTGRKTTYRGKSKQKVDSEVRNEVLLIGVLALTIFLFLCCINIIKGVVGIGVKSTMFGLFGILAYILPIVVFGCMAFGLSNRGSSVAVIKIVAAGVLLFLIGIMSELIMGKSSTYAGTETVLTTIIADIWKHSSQNNTGGGVIFGTVGYLLNDNISLVGTVFLVIVLGIICVVLITEKSFLGGVQSGGRKVFETAREDADRRRERSNERREQLLARKEEEKKRQREEYIEQEELPPVEKVSRMKKKVSGVMKDIVIEPVEEEPEPFEANIRARKRQQPPAVHRGNDDVHEIVIKDNTVPAPAKPEKAEGFEHLSWNSTLGEIRPVEVEDTGEDIDFEQLVQFKPLKETHQSIVNKSKWNQENGNLHDEMIHSYESSIEDDFIKGMKEITVSDEILYDELPKPITERSGKPAVEAIVESKQEDNIQQQGKPSVESKAKAPKKVSHKYVFPPINKLSKGKSVKGDSDKELQDTAIKLQQTLHNFGVNVTVTEISQGPTVTRYELQPEMGVKVSKIVGLTDDIKLNMAVTDIRIEAPIPGKAAVGIEVPNKENGIVAFRDLIESKSFKDFPSKLAFAVGKDIAGQVVVSDIAKMPHMLIAGATGSGKSVCINTLIMSILYKAHPDDVKLIMIDPKVVELSVYNGIPHLLLPVVTDPKKASASLQWAVNEMSERYKKFADYNVRDLKGFNKNVDSMLERNEPGAPEKMPQIVIIVDELADLMMAASKEVEESICRLAQLARAAGIHLIIATQRPSVDVITGLIKANMPSRIAFSVSSGVDSRTILDMVGAERLLGKGDMLFYPQGFTKPSRVQGAFVSDKEVADVVEFIKAQNYGSENAYSEGVEERITGLSSAAASPGGEGGNDFDAYFVEAGKFVIEKNKASIGMLQRVFKIGFNRAARIVDQLESAGVVGAEEGTKPRKILMTAEEFADFAREEMYQ